MPEGTDSEMMRRDIYTNGRDIADLWKADEERKKDVSKVWEAIDELRKILTEHRVSTARTMALIQGAGIVINAIVMAVISYLLSRGHT